LNEKTRFGRPTLLDCGIANAGRLEVLQFFFFNLTNFLILLTNGEQCEQIEQDHDADFNACTGHVLNVTEPHLATPRV
jgi:hypothetical protein